MASWKKVVKVKGKMSSCRLEAQRRYRNNIKNMGKYWRERRLLSLIQQGIIVLTDDQVT